MSKNNGDCHSTNIQPSGIQPEQLTAYVLGQLRGEELAAVKAAVGEGGNAAKVGRGSPDPAHRLTEGLQAAQGDLRSEPRRGQETCAEQVREVQALAGAIAAARSAEPLPKPSVELRAAIERKLDEQAVAEAAKEKVTLATAANRGWRPTAVEWTIIGGICCVLVALLLPAIHVARESARRAQANNSLRQLALSTQDYETSKHLASSEIDDRNRPARIKAKFEGPDDGPSNTFSAYSVNGRDSTGASTTPTDTRNLVIAKPVTGPVDQPDHGLQFAVPASESAPAAGTSGGGAGYGGGMPGQGQQSGQRGQGYGGYAEASGYPGSSSGSGKFGPAIKTAAPGTAAESAASVAELAKLNEEVAISGRSKEAKNATLVPWFSQPNGEAQRSGEAVREFDHPADPYNRQSGREVAEQGVRLSTAEHKWHRERSGRLYAYGDSVGGEQYEPIIENAFLAPISNPLSTFSIDVDTASYANVRRFLNEGRLPPPSAVRIEELVNYFTYSYPQPTGKEPFSVNMEAAECPWNAGHLLLRVGLKGKEIHRSERPPSNLTFLLDVSGSMSDANKLPLLKTTLMMFVAELTENDRVSIVTYAGDAGLRLPPTLGHEKDKIMAAIDSLSAGGSTHGSAGIQLAYEQAGQYFLKEGTNRVILATDGDLNVGVTSDDALVELIKQKAGGGTFLTVLGFGTGNLKDGKLEKLADNGNGVYAYIDGVREGRKVLVEQMSGSLVTIAKDVKIQIEFNPAQIASYRLLGYENRVLAAEDFNNDKKDAGEIGAGHTVTALYELVPVGAKEQAVAAPTTEPLKYQAVGSGSQKSEVRDQEEGKLTEAAASGELLTLKLRYKEPDGIESRLVEFPLKERGGKFNAASKDLQFAAAVASLGMILRGSEHRGTGNLPAVAEIAGGAIGDDPSGYRAEFVDLVRKAQSLGAK